MCRGFPGQILDVYPRRRDLVLDLNAGRLGANMFDPNEFRARVVGGIEGVMFEPEMKSRAAGVCHGGVNNA